MSLRPRIAATPDVAQSGSSSHHIERHGVAPRAIAPPVNVAIDSVVLHGLPVRRADAERIRVALAAELSAHWSPGEIANLRQRMSAPLELRIRESDSPEAIARALANALMRAGSRAGGLR